jgi:COP9 signalosome complex subunit 1
MGNEDLGTHYYRIGDLVNASKAYSRMRDYCTTPAHIASTAFRIIAVAVEQRNWMAVSNQVLKIQNLQMKPDDANRYAILVPPTTGLQRLSAGEYKDAAASFLVTDPSVGDQFNATMSPNDIAVYGGLCALASMSRSELQARVLDNPSFRNFLELEPHIRRAVSFFVACKYSQCLEILESYRNDYLLDLYLQPHVARIYRKIREKSIVQYFEPFGSVKLDNMEKVFGAAALKSTTSNGTSSATSTTTISLALLDELVSLIEKGKLDARLDLEKNILVARQPDLRTETYKEAEEMLGKFSKEAYLKLMRIQMTNAGLETKAPAGKKGKGVGGEWEDGPAGGGISGEVFGGAGGGRQLRGGLR